MTIDQGRSEPAAYIMFRAVTVWVGAIGIALAVLAGFGPPVHAQLRGTQTQ